jgi:hypothetical protein
MRNYIIAALAATAIAGCGGKVPGAPSMPGGVPGGVPGGASGEVDPNTCGNYAASDAGAKLKIFLQSIKDFEAETTRTANVVKESCAIMGKELGMAEADLGGDTKEACNKVFEAYKANLKVAFKANLKLKVVAKPAVCKVDASASASASGACAGSTGTGGTSGSCAASAQASASIHAECTPPQFSIEADAKFIVDKSKAEATLKAMRDGMPKLLDVQGRIKPMQDAATAMVKAAADLKDMGPKFVQSFADQAMCITGQLAAAANATTHIQANVSVSVEVSASASGSVGG